MDILVSLAAGLATSLFFMGMASLAVYWALIRSFKPRTAILLGALVLLVYVGGSFVAGQMGDHPDSLAGIQQAFDQIWQSKAKTFADDKIPQSEIDMYQKILKNYFLFCLPAWVVSGSLFIGFIAYYLVSSMGSRLTPRITAPVPFWRWMIPEPVVFGVVLGAGMVAFAPAGTLWEIVGDNLLVLFGLVYAFAGLPILSFFFNKWRFPIVARVLCYFLLFELTFVVVFCVLGVMDVWLDFRKLKKPTVELTA